MELLCSLRRCFDPLKGVELTAVGANTLLSAHSVTYTFLCNTLEFGKIDARCLIAVGQQYFVSVFSLNCTLCVDSPVVAPEKTSQRSDRTTSRNTAYALGNTHCIGFGQNALVILRQCIYVVLQCGGVFGLDATVVA